MLEFKDSGRTIFSVEDTVVGLVWGPAGVRRLILGRDVETVRGMLGENDLAPLRKRPTGAAARLVQRIRAHLKGRNDDFLDVPVDLGRQSEFGRRVLDRLREVPPGRTTTYGELASASGRPGAARAVGRIMGANPVPLIVPCHRCLGKDGSLTGFSTEGGLQFKARLLQREGFVANPRYEEGLNHLRRADPVLARIINKAGPYRPLPDKPQPPWDTLVTAIIHQQLSVKAGRTIADRVRRLTPGRRQPTAAQILALSPEKLRAAGLSGQKVSYVVDLAARVQDGSLRLNDLKKMSDEEVIQELTKVRGIGRWSAQMHLIFHLDRLDVLPTGDLGLRMAAARFYGLEEYATPSELEEIATPWAPFRSMGSWFLWRGLESGGI